MPRGPRDLPANGIVHINMRGNNKRCLFFRKSEYKYFKKLLLRYKKKYRFCIYHYALMKNHVHLCVKLNEETNMSKAMQGIQLSYFHYHNRVRRYVGHLWQGRFKSPIIDSQQYLLSVGLYIENNPVAAGVVEDPAEYQWSSYRYYALGEEDVIVDTNPLFHELGNSPLDRQKEYIELMKTRIKYSKDDK
ncbi:transposase [Candidatus Omnitrophota bacterium]